MTVERRGKREREGRGEEEMEGEEVGNEWEERKREGKRRVFKGRSDGRGREERRLS